jgi:hypothetical protein
MFRWILFEEPIIYNIVKIIILLVIFDDTGSFNQYVTFTDSYFNYLYAEK